MNYAPLVKEVGRGARGARDLARAQAEQLFGEMLDGTVPDMELGALPIAMRIKGDSADATSGRRTVLLPSFNGARKQAKLTPLMAQLLAREGVPVRIFDPHDFLLSDGRSEAVVDLPVGDYELQVALHDGAGNLLLKGQSLKLNVNRHER
ncbi:MAG: hypothetical protein EOP35_22490 [Rubrivivax sp.]|nr:MAG: hypothetical protein EOP35_22490 [Rubrivivax sp.]